MAIAAVMVADLYTGFSATAWSGWIFFAVYLGIVIVWVFTVSVQDLHPLSIYDVFNVDRRPSILLFHRVMESLLSMETLTSSSTRHTSGFVSLWLSCWRWPLSIFWGAGNLFSDPQTSTLSDGSVWRSQIGIWASLHHLKGLDRHWKECWKPKLVFDRLPLSYRDPGHGGQVSSVSSLGWIKTIRKLGPRVEWIWLLVRHRLTVGLILLRRRVVWRYRGYRLICLKGERIWGRGRVR